LQSTRGVLSELRFLPNASIIPVISELQGHSAERRPPALPKGLTQQSSDPERPTRVNRCVKAVRKVPHRAAIHRLCSVVTGRIAGMRGCRTATNFPFAIRDRAPLDVTRMLRARCRPNGHDSSCAERRPSRGRSLQKASLTCSQSARQMHDGPMSPARLLPRPCSRRPGSASHCPAPHRVRLASCAARNLSVQ
jgi:hypothetical protein